VTTTNEGYIFDELKVAEMMNKRSSRWKYRLNKGAN
jgi:hypothetical protein